MSMTLMDACREVMNDAEVMARYPKGVSAVEVLDEIERKHPGGFPMVSWLDVHDEMRKFYGDPR